MRASTRKSVVSIMVLVICFIVRKAAARSDKYSTMPNRNDQINC